MMIRAAPVATSTAKPPSKIVIAGTVIPATAAAAASSSAAIANDRVTPCRSRGRNEPASSRSGVIARIPRRSRSRHPLQRPQEQRGRDQDARKGERGQHNGIDAAGEDLELGDETAEPGKPEGGEGRDRE